MFTLWTEHSLGREKKGLCRQATFTWHSILVGGMMAVMQGAQLVLVDGNAEVQKAQFGSTPLSHFLFIISIIYIIVVVTQWRGYCKGEIDLQGKTSTALLPQL